MSTSVPSTQYTPLDDLFPLPSPPPSTFSPARVFGVTEESGEALRKVLKDNHERWHAFFNDHGFHNHASHHLLAIYALGAPGPLIEAAYPTHTVYQRSIFPSPGTIDRSNFVDHLGDAKYYSAYMKFFEGLLLEKDADVASILEEFVFSATWNFDPARKGKSQPQMLNRLLSGIVHPLIHVGYGAEFGLKGILAEGLAQTAIHEPNFTTLLPESFFDNGAANISASGESIVSRLTAAMPSMTLNATSHNPKAASSGTHIFTLIARMLKDPRLALNSVLREVDVMDSFKVTLKRSAEVLAEYAKEWTVDGHNPEDVKNKLEELSWAQALIYGIGGWREGIEFSADFFTMHLVTSVIFLPSLVSYLTPASQSALLRSYFVVTLLVWIARGRPDFAIEQFFASTTASPAQPGTQPTPDSAALAPATLAPNPWLPILQMTIMHPGEHVCKLQRALAHMAAVYGTRARGCFAGTELPGAARLDGTLFVRVAGLTADKMGWVREGQAPGAWSREGFFDED